MDDSAVELLLSFVKVKVTGVQQFVTILTGTHVPYRITQCYLPPGRGDIPAVTPAEPGTRFSDPGGKQRLS